MKSNEKPGAPNGGFFGVGWEVYKMINKQNRERANEIRSQMAKSKHLQAIASGNPKQWYSEQLDTPKAVEMALAYIKHKYADITPEQATEELSKLEHHYIPRERCAEDNTEHRVEDNTMIKTRITKEISIDEMKTMREEQGMTNKQIADALGVSYGTVHRYIGAQPVGMRAAPGTYTRPVDVQETPAYTNDLTPPWVLRSELPPTWKPEDWKQAETIHKLTGVYMYYEVNSTTNIANVTLIDGHIIGNMNKADLMKCIDELTHVAELIK